MPTLYDNFSQVRQYIDQHQGGDMSAYVTKDELSGCGYITSIPNTYASYTGVYSYLNSLGISKGIDWETVRIDSAIISDSELVGDIYINDIYWYDIPTYTAISAMGYITSGDVSQMGYMTQAASYAYLSVENLRTNNNRPVQLRATGLQFISSNYTIAPREISYEYINTSSYNNAWIGNTTLKNYVNGRLEEIEASYVSYSYLSNTINNFIWTGTSAEYAALSDYITYQIYLIQEA